MMNLKGSILKLPIIRTWKMNQQKRRFKGSEKYWEERYSGQGNSGSGSYDHLAEFKADFLNDFVKNYRITSVIEFGCGDGNQLKLAEYPKYIGLDVSTTAVRMCEDLFKEDASKSFFLYNSLAFCDRAGIFKAELSMSLDVLFHLVEYEIFSAYLVHLFQSSSRFVIIYASDYDQEQEPVYRHEHRRNFTRFVTKQFPDWKLKEFVRNKYPVETHGEKGSLSDFYIYEKA
jgi:hypothetical protein